MANAFRCRPIDTRRVLLASGREEEWPISVVSIVLEGQEGPTFCLLGPDGGPALLGVVTLEEFALGVDPVAKRLVPDRSYGAVTRVRILLTEEQNRKLEALATALRSSKARLVREGVELLLRRKTAGRSEPLLELIGRAGKAGRPDISVAHDRYLAPVRLRRR